jgi:hypothetical protein
LLLQNTRASGFGAFGLAVAEISTPFAVKGTVRMLQRVLGSSKVLFVLAVRRGFTVDPMTIWLIAKRLEAEPTIK